MHDGLRLKIEDTAGELPEGDYPWLFRASGLAIASWDPARGGEEASAGRRPWHLVRFVHSGAIRLHARGKASLVDATAVLTLNPGEPLRMEPLFGGHGRGSAIAVRRDLLLELLEPRAFREGRPEGLFSGTHVHGLLRAQLLQRLLIRGLQEGTAREPLAVEETALRILRQVLLESLRRGAAPAIRRHPSRARRRYAEDAKALMQQRFRERLRLADVARSLYVSPYHLCRLFREETGVPFHGYLNRLRLREALEPIAEGEADLTGLALGLGFSSHSHFTAVFRKELGITPRQVKKLAAAQLSELARSLPPEATPRGCRASAAARPPAPPRGRCAGGSPRRRPPSPGGTRG